MLYGKINPPAVSVVQVTPFSSTTITADLMVVIARPYALGSTNVNFQVTFGNGEISGDTITSFENIINSNIILGQEQIKSWGLDDTVIMNEIAKDMGTQVIATYTGSTGRFGF